MAKPLVAYFYDADIGNYAYGAGHLMKPHRVRMTHDLVMNYGIHSKMEIFRAKPASKFEMTQFHTDEYIEFLSRVTIDNQESAANRSAALKHNVGEDCPIFDGMFELFGISAGGSMEGAARLNRRKCDVAVNWAGGMHHAKKNEASGFCYVNDIVLGIIELLRFHRRVLYIDIDVHHGDGVEEAFYTTDRVMCVSFHKYGEFFPGTGDLQDIGIGAGRNYSVNIPLRDGIDDANYKDIFESVIGWTMEMYQPDAIVLQCGADSLSGDRLGPFNLSMRGHANCINHVQAYGKPTLILGGGGYSIRNVARTWAFETGQLVGMSMAMDLPYTDYYEHYGPDYQLDVLQGNMKDANNKSYLDKIKAIVYDNLRRTNPVPSVQLHNVPAYPMGMEEDIDEQDSRLEDEENDEEQGKEKRWNQRAWGKRIERDDEHFDVADDEERHRTEQISKDPGHGPLSTAIVGRVDESVVQQNVVAETPTPLAADTHGLDEGTGEEQERRRDQRAEEQRGVRDDEHIDVVREEHHHSQTMSEDAGDSQSEPIAVVQPADESVTEGSVVARYLDPHASNSHGKDKEVSYKSSSMNGIMGAGESLDKAE